MPFLDRFFTLSLSQEHGQESVFHEGIRSIDKAFAYWLINETPEQQADEWMAWAAACVSYQAGRGYTCLDFKALLQDPVIYLGLENPSMPWLNRLASITLNEWKVRCLQSPWVSDAQQDDNQDRPLVWHQDALYLRRMWACQSRIEKKLAMLGHQALESSDSQKELYLTAHDFDCLFPLDEGSRVTQGQKEACEQMLHYPWAVLTGGPGTGKTTTIVRALALLQVSALRNPLLKRPLRVAIAAPTGKAATRVAQSMAHQWADLPLEKLGDEAVLRKSLMITPVTLHQLLGKFAYRSAAYHAGALLPVDVLVVDEASMMDIEMFDALLQALPSCARLIVVGDQHQLSSVEAGSVFSSLCEWKNEQQQSYTVSLLYSQRFQSDSGIGLWADYVRKGQIKQAVEVLSHSVDANFILHALMASEKKQENKLSQAIDQVIEEAAAGWKPLIDLVQQSINTTDEEAFEKWGQAICTQLTQFQILAAHRQGLWGVQWINEHVIKKLFPQDRTQQAQRFQQGPYFAGQVIMVTRNQPALQLMNGDMGVVVAWWDLLQSKTVMRAVFPMMSSQGIKPRWVHLSSLQHIETAFAMTIHKAQGSEFEHVMVMLPANNSPLLTRELIYTGVTRAKKKAVIVLPSDLSVLTTALQKQAFRSARLS